MWWSGLGFVTSLLDLLTEIWESLGHQAKGHVPYAAAVGMFLFAGTMLGRILIWAHDELEGSDGDH